MTILIRPEEFEDELSVKWHHKLLFDPSIDYATNTLNSWIKDKEVVVFDFNKYGFINDNRFNNYDISVGAAGIMIEIKKSK